MFDDSIIRRLAYTKSLYLIAKDQYLKYSEIEISRSILSLDNSIESFFWIILDIKKPTLDIKNSQFFSILNEIKNISSELDVHTLKQMHIVRNKIQHNGILPSKSMADRFFKSSEKIFENLTKEHLQINWSDISLTNLIKDKNIARICKKSEEFYNKGRYSDASKIIIMSFEVCKLGRQLSQFGSNMLQTQGSAQSLIDALPKLKPLFAYIDKINEETEIFKLGLDYIKWRDYRLLLGTLNPFEYLYVDRDFKEEFQINEKMTLFNSETSVDEIKEWYEGNFSFIIESIVRWESIAKESSFPFPWYENIE